MILRVVKWIANIRFGQAGIARPQTLLLSYHNLIAATNPKKKAIQSPERLRGAD